MKTAAAIVIALLSIAAAPPANLQPPQPVGRTHVCNYYPDLARRNNWAGKTYVRFDVDATGRIVNVRVAKSSGYPLLDQTAVGCVAQDWKDLPAMQDGTPVASPNHLAVIQFRLRENTGFAMPNPTLLIFIGLSALIAALIVAIGLLADRRQPA